MSRVTSGGMGHLIIVDLRRHPARTVLTAVGIAIGVATIVALLALSAGIERSAAGLINLGGAELGMFQGGVGELTASSLPQSLVPRVRAPARRRRRDADRGRHRRAARAPSFLSSASSPTASCGAASCSSRAAAPARATRPCRRRCGGARAGRRRRPAPAAGRRQLPRRRDLPRRRAVRGPGRRAAARGRRADARPPGRRDDDRRQDRARGAGVARSATGWGDAFPGTVAISQPGQVSRVDTNSLLVRKAAGRVRRARADHRRHRGDEHDADGGLRAPQRVRAAARGRLAAPARRPARAARGAAAEPRRRARRARRSAWWRASSSCALRCLGARLAARHGLDAAARPSWSRSRWGRSAASTRRGGSAACAPAEALG